MPVYLAKKKDLGGKITNMTNQENMNTRRTSLTYIGMDSWSRPVYKDENGKLWKDTDPRSHVPASLYSAVNNEFDGEPDMPFPIHEKFKLLPQRVVW